MNPSTPRGMISARGALGRMVFVESTNNLTVVRLGAQPSEEFTVNFWRLLMEAVAHSKP